jgi:DNA-binding MarR family transcriptional regulator
MDKETARLIKQLEKRGYAAKRAGPSTKKTYDVSLEHVKALEDIAHNLWIAKCK